MGFQKLVIDIGHHENSNRYGRNPTLVGTDYTKTKNTSGIPDKLQ